MNSFYNHLVSLIWLLTALVVVYFAHAIGLIGRLSQIVAIVERALGL